MPQKPAPLTIEEAKRRLDKVKEDNHDSEFAHIEWDEIVEQKLREYDPGFLTSITKYYRKLGYSKWYA